LDSLHNSYLAAILQTRALRRREKKRRKRNIAQGLVSGIFGVGVILANTRFPALAAISYGLGGAAIHQAIRDWVGELSPHFSQS